MIPKLVHRIWFGNKPIPPEYEAYWLSWQRQYPDHAFTTWRDADIDERFLTQRKVAQAEGMVRKADIARYEILYQYGGVYLDCDVMPYHYLDWQRFRSGLVVCNETDTEDYCSIGVIGAAPKNALFQRAIQHLLQKHLNRQPPNLETGPFFFGQMLVSGSPAPARLPTSAFYPYAYGDAYAATFAMDLQETYGIHVWGSSWMSEAELEQKVLNRLRCGDLSEAATLINQVSPQARGEFAEYIELVRQARISSMAVAGHPIALSSLRIGATGYFDLLKCCFYLVDTDRDAVIWQIGAADGIMADPLRPLLINRDPQVVLLEPNPYLFRRLQRNYSRNRNVRFVNAALGRTYGQMTLNAINPEQLADHDLPDWVLGISSFYNDRNALGGLTIGKELTGRIQQAVERLIVDVLDATTLLTLTGNRPPDVVVIDAEGMETDIIKSIFGSGIKPKIIQYETQCLPKAEQDALAAELSKEYVQITSGNDRLAYRTDFLLAYCSDLYVKNGIPTIFQGALAAIVRN
jgi:FkbM family methyltransferase